MQFKDHRQPVVDPLRQVLRSRRVIIALSTFLVTLLITGIPQLYPVRGELFTIITLLSLALIGGLSLEDAAHAVRSISSPDSLIDVDPPNPDTGESN